MDQARTELPFSPEEYAQRVARVRAELQERGLDALLVYWPENIYYLTGYDTLGYFSYQVLVLPLTGEPFFVARRLQRQNVLDATWLNECEVFGEAENPVEATIAALQRRGLARKRLGIELDAWFLTTRNYLRLAPALNLIDASQLVNRLRLVKSSKELEYIRAAARAVEAGAEAGIKAMRVGATENDVAAALYYALITAGSEYQGHAALVATGPRAARALVTWSGRRIEDGDPITFEPGAAVRRYHAMLIRTVNVGKPRDERLVRACEASIEGLEEGLSFIRAGVTAHEVDQATKAAPRRAGLGQYLVNRCGYGVGIGYPPDWGEGRTLSLKEGDETVLEANMTFHFTNAVSWEGVTKANFSETIRVTETGCEVITSFPRQLIIV